MYVGTLKANREIWRSQPCKITRKQYNSGDSELKKETPVQTEVERNGSDLLVARDRDEQKQ